jgi:hypothetical protein
MEASCAPTVQATCQVPRSAGAVEFVGYAAEIAAYCRNLGAEPASRQASAKRGVRVAGGRVPSYATESASANGPSRRAWSSWVISERKREFHTSSRITVPK